MSIWNFREIKKSLLANDYITMGEGLTPTDKYSDENIQIVLKNEQVNPSGSWKDRASAYKLTKLINDGVKEAVIASSGNAAISYLYYSTDLDIKLNVVVSPKTHPEKMRLLEKLTENTQHKLHISENIRKTAIELASTGMVNLKASTDDDLVKAYWSLGFELEELFKGKKGSLFLPASSGTAAVGTVQGLSMLIEESNLPKVYICQTQSIHAFSEDIYQETEDSLADAIIDKTGLRKPQISNIINKTNGKVLIITNEELIKAKEFYKSLTNSDDITYNSLLSIAGYLKVKESREIDLAVCVLSGR